MTVCLKLPLKSTGSFRYNFQSIYRPWMLKLKLLSIFPCKFIKFEHSNSELISDSDTCPPLWDSTSGFAIYLLFLISRGLWLKGSQSDQRQKLNIIAPRRQGAKVIYILNHSLCELCAFARDKLHVVSYKRGPMRANGWQCPANCIN